MNSPSKHSRKSKHSDLTGMYWAHRVFSIGMQMALMPGLGYLADRHFGTIPWLTLIGACLGFGLAMFEVFQLARGGVDRSLGDRARRELSQDRQPPPRSNDRQP